MENLEQPSELSPVDPGLINIKKPVMSEVEQHRLDNPVAVEVMEEIQKLRDLQVMHLPGLLQKVDAILTRVDSMEIIPQFCHRLRVYHGEAIPTYKNWSECCSAIYAAS
jgi:hypothetical protein